MNQDIHLLWQEILTDINSPQSLWQVVIVLSALGVAWLLRYHLQHQVARGHLHPIYKLLMGGFDRLFIPFTAFILTIIARYSLEGVMHVALLRLATRLLITLVIIRLVVYVLRYVFSPSRWLSGFERIITWVLWALVALQLSGYLKGIIQLLVDVKFTIGKQELNLWLLLQGSIMVVVTILTALWISRMVENRLMHAESLSANWRVILVKFVRMIALVIAVSIALSAVGLDLTMLSVFGGALGVGLGLGLQKIASNYVSGLIILLDKSMNIGDLLTIQEDYGVVEELRSRYMVLRKLDGTRVVIPNETLIINSVINHSYSETKVSVKIPIQVSYESDLVFVLNLLTKIALSHSRVLKDPSPSAQIQDFADSGINLLVNVWIDDPENGVMQLRTDIYLEIWNAFKQHGITIPFPQRELRMITK